MAKFIATKTMITASKLVDELFDFYGLPMYIVMNDRDSKFTNDF